MQNAVLAEFGPKFTFGPTVRAMYKASWFCESDRSNFQPERHTFRRWDCLTYCCSLLSLLLSLHW